VFLALGVQALQQPIVVHVVADDLGFSDLGFMNDQKTHTPAVNERVDEGIVLTHYHTYKVCSPSRASIMTGRYPWGVGFYDMHGDLHVPLEYKMMPAVLAENGWSTHAIGKWNLGASVKRYTPTFRGFDSHFGYYNAALQDYWYHSGGVFGCGNNSVSTDFSNSSGMNVSDGVQPADKRLNSTYDSELFGSEAVRLIRRAGNSSSGMYIYLAFQNVHRAGDIRPHDSKPGIPGGGAFQSPCNTVDSFYAHTALDSDKMLGAMVTELDYGIGNVTAALQASGREWLMILTSDNGGPNNLGNANFPLKGGKHTLWDGGVRVVSFLSGTLIPSSLRGTRWGGLAHSSDWYRTIVEGIAKAHLPVNTGPRPFDGFNLWPAILSNLSSPRTEIIHQVQNNFTNGLFGPSQNLTDPAVIRVGRLKLIIGGDPGDANIRAWPALAHKPVAFGKSNGSRDAYDFERLAGMQHCRSPPSAFAPKLGSCQYGGCLFDLEADEGENVNLINDTHYTADVARLTARLKQAAASGPPWAWPYSGPEMRMLRQEICDQQGITGYYEPIRLDNPYPPTPRPTPRPTPPPHPTPPSPPAPTPVWQPCITNLTRECPYSHPPDYEKCMACGKKCCNRTNTVEKYCNRSH
jgi:arylsulfatase B/arylsulfatase I/J